MFPKVLSFLRRNTKPRQPAHPSFLCRVFPPLPASRPPDLPTPPFLSPLPPLSAHLIVVFSPILLYSSTPTDWCRTFGLILVSTHPLPSNIGIAALQAPLPPYLILAAVDTCSHHTSSASSSPNTQYSTTHASYIQGIPRPRSPTLDGPPAQSSYKLLLSSLALLHCAATTTEQKRQSRDTDRPLVLHIAECLAVVLPALTLGQPF